MSGVDKCYINASATYKTCKIIFHNSGSTAQLVTRFQTQQELNEKGATRVRNPENSHQKVSEGLGFKKRWFT